MKPELQYSILCDDVRQEKNGKFMFLGAFNVIAAQKFPMSYCAFHIANQWCNGAGQFKEQSRVVDEDNRVIITSPEVFFTLKDFDSSHFVISRFQNIKFERPGKHSVEVMLDGELFRRFPFSVVEIQKEVVS